MTRTPKLYRELFGRDVPEDLLVPVNKRDILNAAHELLRSADLRTGPHPPYPKDLLSQEFGRRDQLLRDFLGVATEAEVLPALKSLLFDGFTAVDPPHPRYVHDEVLQIMARMALGDTQTEAAKMVEKRRQTKGDARPWRTILRDFQATPIFQAAKRGEWLIEKPLQDSGILDPLTIYGAQNPNGHFWQVKYQDTRNAHSFGDGSQFGLHLKFALGFYEPKHPDWFTGGLSAEVRAEIVAEMGADVVIVDKPASGFPLRGLLESIGLSVTPLFAEGALAALPTPSVFLMIERGTPAMAKAIDAYLDKAARSRPRANADN